MPWAAAEVQIDEELLRRLLAAQHPDLAGRSLRRVNAGFDNELWRLGDDLAVRIPRRAVAASLLANEQRWLPELAPLLPLPVPAPIRTGAPSPLYPWPWSVVAWLAGQPGDQVPVTDAEDAGRRLGQFLAALHRPASPSAPFNPWRSVPLSDRAATFEAALPHLGTGSAAVAEQGGLRQVWQGALDAPPYPGPPVWVHGDLHPANTLIGDGSLVGVIDFGDLCAGDPATDVAAVWLLLPPEGLGPFTAAYGGVDPGLAARSLGWASLFGLILHELGTHGRPTYDRMARAALDRILSRPAARGGW